jgi:putative tricarboxylic transport membrane protein
LIAQVRNAKDLFAGLLFVVIGAAAIVIGRGYPLGSTSQMGPGYFPMLVGGLLIVIGLIVAVRAFATRSEPIGRLDIKSVLLVIGAVSVFAAGIEQLGLVLSILLVVILGYAANAERKLTELVILALVLALAAAAIFVYGLQLPFKVWPELG